MKNLLLILLCMLLIFSCGSEETNYKLDNNDLSHIEDEIDEPEVVSNKDIFKVSEQFIKADDQTVLSLLIDAALLVSMSDEDRADRIIRLKETTEVYVRENSIDHEENLIINKSEMTPSQDVLDMFNSQFESLGEQLMDGVEIKLINSGFAKYQDMFDYIYFKTRFNFDGYNRYSLQYIISVNNENFHIVINTKEGLDINDVFIEIK